MKLSTQLRRAAAAELKEFHAGYELLRPKTWAHGNADSWFGMIERFNKLFGYWYKFRTHREATCLSLCLMADIYESEGA